MQKRHTVVIYFRFCLTREEEFNSLSSSAELYSRGCGFWHRINNTVQVDEMLKKILLLAVVASLFGCAATAPKSVSVSSGVVTSEGQVSARAEARWRTLIAQDLDKAYEFLSPGSKAANPLALYKEKMRPLKWRSAKAQSASCDGEKCSVKLEVTISDRRFGGDATTVLEEIWIKDAGNWWYVFNG